MGEHAEKKGARATKRNSIGKIVCVSGVALVGVLCLVVGLLLGYGRGLLGSIRYTDPTGPNISVVLNSDDVVEQPSEVDDRDLSALKMRGNTQNVINILLVGVDNRGGEAYGRSDTNMILSINRANQTIQLISLMRDTWVQIPQQDANGDGVDDYAKLNAAYSNGGFPLLRETIRKNFLLDIPQYFTVDFAAFDVGVDTLGGLDIELTETEAQWIPKENPGDPDTFARTFEGIQQLEPIGYTAGVYHLQGFQALAYCRLRYIYFDSDYSRQGNQRIVVGKFIEQVKQSSPAKLLSMLQKVLPYVTTNMTQNELENYIVNVFDYMGYETRMDSHIPQAGEFSLLTLSGSEGLWIDDPATLVSTLHQTIYG